MIRLDWPICTFPISMLVSLKSYIFEKLISNDFRQDEHRPDGLDFDRMEAHICGRDLVYIGSRSNWHSSKDYFLRFLTTFLYLAIEKCTMASEEKMIHCTCTTT